MGMLETKKKRESGVLIALVTDKSSKYHITEYLEELAFLADTLHITTEEKFVQQLDHPDPKTFIGRGKLQEIKAYIQMRSIDVAIFDDDLSPSQLRNLEKELNVKIFDRSLLILDIFLKRAQTAQAKTQVELARYQYLLPRLTRMWTHLERQRGGTGTRGGAGEKEIETDRRIIRNQITTLRHRLDKIEKQADNRRKSRQGMVRVALVGYTNAGKSTLMRKLAKEDVYAKDELFATLDATVRKVVINQVPFLLSDTVGFIRKLPHGLIESFKSTLAEVKEADLLLHVINRSSPAYEDHIQVVEETLEELGVGDKPVIQVFNKMDLLKEPLTQGRNGQQHIALSAIRKEDIGELRQLLAEEVMTIHYTLYPNYLGAQSFKGLH